MKLTITETQLKMLLESRHRKKHGPYVEPEKQNNDIDDKKSDDEFYSREDEINYGVEDDEHPEPEEVNETIEKIKSQFKRFL